MTMSDKEREAGMGRLSRGFMTPVVFYAKAGDMVEVQDSMDGPGATSIVEREYAEGSFEPCAAGWFAELSAFGYMDRTGYSGPFASQEEAETYLVETFDDADGFDDEEDDDET